MKIQLDDMFWKFFTMTENTMKIRQMKRYCDKFNKLDLELSIWIISRRSWKIKSHFERAWFYLWIFSQMRGYSPKSIFAEVEKNSYRRFYSKNLFNSGQFTLSSWQYQITSPNHAFPVNLLFWFELYQKRYTPKLTIWCGSVRLLPDKLVLTI